MPEGPPGGIVSGDGDGEGESWQRRRCDNPWKPNAQHGQSEVYRRMLGILNRVTHQSLSTLLEQAQQLPLADPEHLPHILALFISKAQDEPMFSPVYSQMCRELSDMLGLQDAISIACENHFQENYLALLQYEDQLQGPISCQLVHEEILARKRLIGHMRFLSELQRVGVIDIEQLAATVQILLLHEDERSLELLCRFMAYTGQSLERSHQDLISRSCDYLQRHLNGGSLSPRLRFLIQDTVDLRGNGWRPRGGHHHSAVRNGRG